MNRVCSSVQKCVLPLGLFVCLFLLGRCVYKLHYSKVKKRERNARTFTREWPSVPKARYSEISIFRKIVRNIFTPTKSNHLFRNAIVPTSGAGFMFVVGWQKVCAQGEKYKR